MADDGGPPHTPDRGNLAQSSVAKDALRQTKLVGGFFSAPGRGNTPFLSFESAKSGIRVAPQRPPVYNNITIGNVAAGSTFSVFGHAIADMSTTSNVNSFNKNAAAAPSAPAQKGGLKNDSGKDGRERLLGVSDRAHAIKKEAEDRGEKMSINSSIERAVQEFKDTDSGFSMSETRIKEFRKQVEETGGDIYKDDHRKANPV